ncbi:MoaD/ThiS family protein [Desulfovibrio piger]|nr:MoaD/ThiS family protein [Desulfovibrio piger]
MRLHIKLSTTLRDYVKGYEPEKGLHVEVPDGMTVGELARHIGLPLEEIKIVMVNGRHSEADDAMRDGDRIAFFPAVGGG